MKTSTSLDQRAKRRIAQTRVDATLHEQFEKSGHSFDYSKSVGLDTDGSASAIAIGDSNVSGYLQAMQREGLVQPFGCLLAVEELTFALLAYSENASEMLDFPSCHQVPTTEAQYEQGGLSIGMDVRTLLRPSSVAALEKAAGLAEVHLSNPITVNTFTTGKPLYAILHRVEVGLIIDLEPTGAAEGNLSAVPASPLQSYKLATKAISRLQSLTGGDIGLLCNIVVQEIRELIGYDRVMAYRFHEDDHGEVVAEIRRSDLEPYLGLHYPAIDIPQAARFLFMKNKVRMICNCGAKPAKVIQSKRLEQPLSLSGSTLRAPHGCHAQYMANMGSVASLVMSVTVKGNDDDDEDNKGSEGVRRLWGLVVCHHTSSRFVPFPLRYACEFLMQVFGIQLNKELELAAQIREKHILRTQTVLCDMLLRDAPVGIVTQTPNIMDVVKCDGAALLYGKRLWVLGTAPTEAQIMDIVEWVVEQHKESSGLSTDNLAEAGYPGAASLGDAVCGMAAVRISSNSKDFLLWFRSHTGKEIKWGGAKHDPLDKDDGRRMHPRSSFKAFLQVVERRSIPWEDVEMDAIHSLQLILRGSFQEIEDTNDTKAMIHARLNDLKLQGMEELSSITNEMVRLIETATVPILAVDVHGFINGWNIKAAELTGLSVDQVIGKPLINLLDDNSIETVNKMLSLALQGEEEQNIEIKLKTFGPQKDKGPLILLVNACSSRDLKDNVVGICLVAQDVTHQKVVMDKFTQIQGDYRAIVQNPSPLIPPIFGTDEYGCCSEWNAAMARLSGWQREEVISKTLVGEVFGIHPICCQLKSQDALTKLRIVLNSAMAGQETEKIPFFFFDRHGKNKEVLMSANKRTDAEGQITGVFCFLHVTSPELKQALQVQQTSEQAALSTLKKLAYIRHEIRNPLHGIMCNGTLLEGTALSELQKRIVKTSALCQQQLLKILDDTDLESIEDGYLELDTVEFSLGDILDAVISQGMILSREKGLQLTHDLPEAIKTMHLYGDQLRLQQIFSVFLLNVLRFTPPEGWVRINVVPNKKHLGSGVHVMHLKWRITHSGQGIPEELLKEMFDHDQDKSSEGLGLHICQKLVDIMNGDVRYSKEIGESSFILNVELPLAQIDDQ